MDKLVSELTYKVVAYSVVPNFVWDECVDWAYEMLLSGYDTPSLVLLASITKPTDSFEALPYLKAALLELGIKERVGEDAEILYCSYFIKKISAGENVRFNLSKLQNFYDESGFGGNLCDFYSLHFAWSDFDDGMKHQWYWQGATKDNIADILKEAADKWLKEHEGRTDLQ